MLDTYNNYSINSNIPTNTSYINIAITAFNVLVFVLLNFIVYFPRRKNERNYQLQAALFKSFVVDNIKDITSYSTDVVNIPLNLSITIWHPTIILAKIEKACDEIEALNTDFSNSIIPVINCYNENMAEELAKAAEQLYDNTTELVTMLVSENDVDKPTTEQILSQNVEFMKKFKDIMNKYKPNV